MNRANDPVHPNMMEAGLTIREHFAGLAMQAMIGTAAAPCIVDGLGGAESHCAASAVKMADALLAELAKVKP